MRFPYDDRYQPPLPVVRVVLHNNEEGLRTDAENAMLDTGSDGSLIPISHLLKIYAPALIDTRLRSHWGEWREAQLFVVDIDIDGLRLPGIFVVGDEQGDEIVLGRNVLNRLRLLLDGPARLAELPAQ